MAALRCRCAWSVGTTVLDGVRFLLHRGEPSARVPFRESGRRPAAGAGGGSRALPFIAEPGAR